MSEGQRDRNRRKMEKERQRERQKDRQPDMYTHSIDPTEFAVLRAFVGRLF